MRVGTGRPQASQRDRWNCGRAPCRPARLPSRPSHLPRLARAATVEPPSSESREQSNRLATATATAAATAAALRCRHRLSPIPVPAPNAGRRANGAPRTPARPPRRAHPATGCAPKAHAPGRSARRGPRPAAAPPRRGGAEPPPAAEPKKGAPGAQKVVLRDRAAVQLAL